MLLQQRPARKESHETRSMNRETFLVARIASQFRDLTRHITGVRPRRPAHLAGNVFVKYQLSISEIPYTYFRNTHLVFDNYNSPIYVTPAAWLA